MTARGIPRAASRLVAIHPLVAGGEQLFERRAVLGEPRRARADRQRDADAGPRLERVRSDRALEVGDAPRFVLRIAIPQDDDELVAREARAQVVMADRRSQDVADDAQRPVAGFVAVGVVDLL